MGLFCDIEPFRRSSASAESRQDKGSMGRRRVYQEYALSTRRPLFCFGPFEACLDEQQDWMKIEEHLPDGIHLHLGPQVGLLYTKIGHLERSIRQIPVEDRKFPLYSLLTSISA